MFFILLPIIFLPLAFQIQWQENEGQENEAGGYQKLLTTAVSKKTCFSVCPESVSLGAEGDDLRKSRHELVTRSVSFEVALFF
jgi:hypothetical protein